MPNYRDAETGHYTTAEDAAARPAETVAARHETPDMAELRRLAEAATPGPWRTEYLMGAGNDLLTAIVAGRATPDDLRVIGSTLAERDGKFVAAANPSVVLALLDELDALTARLADSDAPHPDRPDCAIVGGSGIRVTATDLETGESQSAVIDDNYALICAGNRYQSGIQYHANGTVTLTVSVRKRLAPVDAVLAAAELRAAPDEEPQP